MDVTLIPSKQESPPTKEITFYSRCKKADAPQHAIKISKEELRKKKYSITERELVNKYLGDNKHCNFWIWEETVQQKHGRNTLHIGSNNYSEDYLVVNYNEDGNAIKISHLRVSMFRENYDTQEILNDCSLTSSPIYLVDILDKFNIKLSNYLYPMKDVKWESSYDLMNAPL